MFPIDGLMVVDLVGYIGTLSCIVEKEIEIFIGSIQQKIKVIFQSYEECKALIYLDLDYTWQPKEKLKC